MRPPSPTNGNLAGSVFTTFADGHPPETASEVACFGGEDNLLAVGRPRRVTAIQRGSGEALRLALGNKISSQSKAVKLTVFKAAWCRRKTNVRRLET
jgi:hypothetical protein